MSPQMIINDGPINTRGQKRNTHQIQTANSSAHHTNTHCLDFHRDQIAGDTRVADQSQKTQKKMSVSGCRSCWMTSGWMAAICVALLCCVHCDACSCKLEHPQMHFCNAHFAVVARIKSLRRDDYNTMYGIKIIKQFKMNEKANYAFRHSRNDTNTKLDEVSSPNDELMCGVHLKKDQVYLLTGRIVEKKPRVALCDFHQPWASMTTKQKKGFKLLYHKSCSSCQVVPCPWWNRKNCKSPLATSCAWDTLFEGEFDCQGLESVCMKQRDGRCGWNGSSKFRKCLKDRKEHKEAQRQLEP